MLRTFIVLVGVTVASISAAFSEDDTIKPGDIIPTVPGTICGCADNKCTPDGCIIPDGGCCTAAPDDISGKAKSSLEDSASQKVTVIYFGDGIYVACDKSKRSQKEKGCRVVATKQAKTKTRSQYKKDKK